MWAMSAILSRVRFTVDDYHRMAEAGILEWGQRVELLDGEIVEMTPIGRRHAACVDRLNVFFVETTRTRANVRVQNPVRLDDRNEPKPDVTLLKPREDFYAERELHAEDVLLLIEVAESSLEKDTQIKLPLYARAGVVEVWIADLTSRTLHVYRRPADGRYAEHLTITGDQSVTPVNFPELTVTIPQVFGR